MSLKYEPASEPLHVLNLRTWPQGVGFPFGGPLARAKKLCDQKLFLLYLDLYWVSLESGDLWYKSKELKKII